MRESYQYWDVGYAPPQEKDIDPAESDEAMGEYIERRRAEFYEEWLQYLDENQ